MFLEFYSILDHLALLLNPFQDVEGERHRLVVRLGLEVRARVLHLHVLAEHDGEVSSDVHEADLFSLQGKDLRGELPITSIALSELAVLIGAPRVNLTLHVDCVS